MISQEEQSYRWIVYGIFFLGFTGGLTFVPVRIIKIAVKLCLSIGLFPKCILIMRMLYAIRFYFTRFRTTILFRALNQLRWVVEWVQWYSRGGAPASRRVNLCYTPVVVGILRINFFQTLILLQDLVHLFEDLAASTYMKQVNLHVQLSSHVALMLQLSCRQVIYYFPTVI